MKSYFFAISLSFFTVTAFAQQAPKLEVSTGAAQGSTYTQMFNEIKQLCGQTVEMNPHFSSGSIENLNRLVGNKVNGAFTQGDVLWLKSQTDNMSNVKTLLALHPEEVHIITLVEGRKKTTGILGSAGGWLPDRVTGAQVVQINDLSNLGGMTVAAAGGSHMTAQALLLLTQIPFSVVEAPSNDEAINMLRDGRADAVIGVGGAPLGWVEKLDRSFKLVPIFEMQKEKLKSLYTNTSLSYPNLGAAGIPTVSTEALFVTREYKTPRFVQALGKLRSCVHQSIDELRETIGGHVAKWQAVDVNNKGKLPWYELPAAAQ